MIPKTQSETYEIISMGEIVMDMYPEVSGDSTGKPEKSLAEPGGANANVAVAAARLGARSAFIGKVGNDPQW